MTQSRSRHYSLQENDASMLPDIVLVNIDDRASVQEWCQKYLDKATNKRKCPTIVVGNQKPEDCKLQFLKLPFFAPKVLKTLDEITVKELKYVPELSISDSSEVAEPENNGRTGIHQSFSSAEIEQMIDEERRAEPKPKKARVLVVDDSLPVRKALDMKLKLMDYEVQMAIDGHEALSLVEKNNYDSIFLDVVMPGMDGYEVCRKIKRNKAKRHIPVIMLTSRSSPFDRVKGKLAGCDTYLTKPVEHEEFQRVVTGILS